MIGSSSRLGSTRIDPRMFNGYELYWKDEDSARINSRKTPEWAVEWNEDGHDFMTLEHYLDELTYNEQEAK